METSVGIASDSFSYSWLSNCNNESPLDDGLEEPLRKSICRNFNFDTSITTHSPVALVHADELFSDGILRPVVFVGSSSSIVEPCNAPDPAQAKLGSSSLWSTSVPPRTKEIHHGFFARWRRSTWRTLVDFFRYVNQLGQKVGCSRKSTRVDDIWQVKSLSCSQKASPKPITSHPIGYLHDHENSIKEAVLHCKRSVGK